MVTNETEQGRQYKEYTREATGNKAERSAQLLGGEQPWCCLLYLFLPVYFLEA